MMIDTNVFAERIKKLRHQRNLTQEELAELANLSVVYISNVECGKRVPSLDTMLTLCEALYCTPDELLDGFYPDKQKPTPTQIRSLFERSTPSEKQFMLRLCSAFMLYLKDSL